MIRKLLCIAAVSLLSCGGFAAQQSAGSAPQRFTVLRTGRLIAPSETATNADTHCAIVGTGGAATMKCQPNQATIKTSYHYNTALVVDADGTGYIIACRAALVTNLWCKKAEAGTTIEGWIDNGQLSVSDGQKDHRYQVLVSAKVGAIPMTQAAPGDAKGKSPSKPAPGSAPAQAVPSASAAATAPAANPVAAQSSTPDSAACGSAAVACVSFASEPQGADIYVDGKFAGNTPSTLAIAPGSHEVRIVSGKLPPWTRKLETTAGSKVTVRAILQPSGSRN